jgi:cytochrome c553
MLTGRRVIRKVDAARWPLRAVVYNSAPFVLGRLRTDRSVLAMLPMNGSLSKMSPGVRLIMREPIAVLPLLCGLFLIASAPVRAEGSAEAGQAKSTACVACHGVGGNSVNPEWPNLAGQHQPYIVKQLKAFKSGARQNPLMMPMAQQLSDADMEDLAVYFAQEKATGTLEADAGKVAQGQRLFRSGDATKGIAACSSCHGPAGHGNPTALYPSIRGQHATYVEAQLKAYRSGTRETDQNQMMRGVAKSLSDDDITAVAAYVQGLR